MTLVREADKLRARLATVEAQRDEYAAALKVLGDL